MESEQDIKILAERTQHAAGLSLLYRLEFSKGFWLSVTNGEEQASAFLGSDMECAWLLFCQCTKGCVTPCTLEAVCEDFFYVQSVNVGI